MNSLNRRLKDLFGPQPSEHDWCDTTRLANPWSVLFGGRRHEPAEPERERDGAARDGAPPSKDLRDTAGPGADSTGAGKDGSAW